MNTARQIALLGLLLAGGCDQQAAQSTTPATTTATQPPMLPAGTDAVLIEEMNPVEKRVFWKVNDLRAEVGLPPLKPDEQLYEVARRHAIELLRRGEISHVDTDGGRVADRMNSAKIIWSAAGENIGRLRGYDDPGGEVVVSWARSKGHLRNLVDFRYKETGVAAIHDPRTDIWYIVQVYAHLGMMWRAEEPPPIPDPKPALELPDA